MAEQFSPVVFPPSGSDSGFVYPLELSPEEAKLILRIRQLDSPCLLVIDVNGRGQPETLRVFKVKREDLF